MRKCEVTLDGTTMNAIFHKWSEYATTRGDSVMVGGPTGGQIMYPVAVIEYEDGQCNVVPAYCVKFTDKEKKLKIKKVDDADIVAYVSEALKENNGYCPCEVQKTPDTKCICKRFREQNTPGKCRCGLYEKVEE
jgi:hypothetical protein